MKKNVIEEALECIAEWGGFDGAHHKQWALDQVARILTECPTTKKHSFDCNGKRYSYESLGESDAYKQWVVAHNDGEDGPDTYDWDEGIAP